MKPLNVLNRKWKVGDTRDVSEDQLDALADGGVYDSYDQTYEIDGLKWKIVHRVARPDGSTTHTLSAIEEA